MARRRHPKPPVEAALVYAELHGWRVVPGGGQPDVHGRQVRRVVDHCIHQHHAAREPDDD